MIDVNDEARMAISPWDNPYIPEDMKDTAPIIKVMEEIKKMHNNARK